MRIRSPAAQDRFAKRGFTLIELMIVVSILGVLASIALPAFKGFIAHAKRSERNVMLGQIRRGLQSYFNERGAWMNAFGGSTSSAFGSYNPPLPAAWPAGKRTFLKSMPGWSSLPFLPDGDLYYSYFFNGYAFSGGLAYFFLNSMGDVDNDGVTSNHQEIWTIGYYGYDTNPSDGSWGMYSDPNTADTCSDGSPACD